MELKDEWEDNTGGCNSVSPWASFAILLPSLLLLKKERD